MEHHMHFKHEFVDLCASHLQLSRDWHNLVMDHLCGNERNFIPNF
jgi:hypothetical protein